VREVGDPARDSAISKPFSNPERIQLIFHPERIQFNSRGRALREAHGCL